ncbi:helicase-related protein [Chrysosporum bergii ANA360D]|uniref:Helicase-related protein n=1 Tax=Chrysosporum bergii ANA360D TaxID=617107 RepID=A0AA43KBG0_9CYAN|nr:helicase-related protein [Chrysosporum bergii]MDH6060402.1 helicase-related protein [Chrysosporum bergii ANA360D]
MRLEEITKGAWVKGILDNQLVTVIDVQWYADNVMELTYKDSKGHTGQKLLYRDRESTLEIVTKERPWSFNGDGYLLRLVSEAQRIQLAHLFDPLLAVHSSLVEPLPHQITAVYGEMLNRQPLRFLLADDPGAGKTIMAGLLIAELHLRGDLHRCLVVCPGSLAAQWQDELYQRFHLEFEILTNDRIETARTGNALAEIPLAIARLDKLSRNQDLQAKLTQTDWDLIICDEAHKMSASFFGGDIRETKRYKLGKLLSSITRHFLLMTATPHNGKEEDYQLFMALLDGDRFEGKFRDGVHVCDTSDLMRRLVKEDLLKFDGTPLFPERRAYTVDYKLSQLESILYKQVTEYVREEFNRAEGLDNQGRKGTVGFALTILQRRLASSPEAIYQSLLRRRERLQKRLREEEIAKRGKEAEIECFSILIEDVDELEDDIPSEEREATEQEVVDQASAARTITELKTEITQLQKLEQLALQVRRSGTDKKWEELSQILQNQGELFDTQGYRRKLVIFTEHRDTLNYLQQQITTLLGNPTAIVTIHGAMGREERRKSQEAFTQDPEVQVLIATDAAGEGINLQRAHLMVNYDLPWNPNRLEQRFGRIHRIGQTEVCHLWNLVAKETREGDVYLGLLKKLEIEQNALGGKVFDVLGKAIDGAQLRKLLIDAIRYGDSAEVKAKLSQVVAQYLDRQKLQHLLAEKALVQNTMDISRVQEIRAEMERAEARKLQPHFIAAFFQEALEKLGGTVREREPRRYEVTHVPSVIRNRGRILGKSAAILPRYERVCFDKQLISIAGKPLAALICPGHPLLEATIDLILERHRNVLKQGGILLDRNDPSEQVRVLVYLEHCIQDGSTNKEGHRHVVSRRMQYVEIDDTGQARNAGHAPYLNYEPLPEADQALIEPTLSQSWLLNDIEAEAAKYAIAHIVPQHLEEVKQHKEELIDKTIAAVKDRLGKEINYWDHRASELKAQETAGKINAKINSAKARTRADELEARLKKREEDLKQERRISPLPPVVIGGALIIPIGLIQRLEDKSPHQNPSTFAQEKRRIEILAMQAVMNTEQQLGYEPKDVSADKCGYDIESRIPSTGKLRFIEVKGRIAGADTITVTKNEIITALNKPDNFILALVQVPQTPELTPGEPWKLKDPQNSHQVKQDHKCVIRYLQRPFDTEPGFAVTSVNYSWSKLWEQGTDNILL